MRFIRLLIIVLIIVFFAIIYTQNLEVFTHQFELQMDLNQYMVGPYITTNIVLILAAFVLGVVVSIIFGALSSITASSESRQKSRRIKELEAQLAEQPNPLSVGGDVAGGGSIISGGKSTEESESSAFSAPSK